MIWDTGRSSQQESSELPVQYCAQIGITSEDPEWENSMWICSKPSVGSEYFHACASVAFSYRKFGRVVLQGWLDLVYTRPPHDVSSVVRALLCVVPEEMLEDFVLHSGVCA